MHLQAEGVAGGLGRAVGLGGKCKARCGDGATFGGCRWFPQDGSGVQLAGRQDPGCEVPGLKGGIASWRWDLDGPAFAFTFANVFSH